MNSKESFLASLQSGLAVLAKSEQQDILAEYAQHIDLKIAGGLTEEEAIEDFGDIHQLTAEILEAYHVNPSYAARSRKLSQSFALRPLASLGMSHLRNLLRSGVHRLSHVMTWILQAVKAVPERLFGKVRNSSQEGETGVRQKPVDAGSTPSDTRCQKTGKVRKSIWQVFQQVGGASIMILSLAAWIMWNGILLICAVPIIFFALIILIILGILGVWLFQGIPLVGSFLCCVGILASCVGILGLGSNLIWHRKTAAESDNNEKIFLTEDYNDPENSDAEGEEAFDYAEK